MTTATKETVGIIGLGIMGSAYAKNLLDSGHAVIGTDVAEAAMAALAGQGGRRAASAREVAEAADILLLALPSVKALEAVTKEIAGAVRHGAVVCEMGTLPIEAKEACRLALEGRGAQVLDCPVSGTGAQAAKRDLSIYASGDEAAFRKVEAAFAGFARDVRYCGGFGTGMKLKYIANLLVTIHNLSTAEALLLAERAGLDLNLVYDAIRPGAGGSRMFDVRAPMMIEERYEPATMKMDIYIKDLQLIMDFAREMRAPTPLMTASLPFYFAALAQGRGKEDTASLFAVLKGMTEPHGKGE
ncbi:NAD(P)-dependent oxidoreductase [Ancylobacter defluvii]|uniref:2-hydroxy-3-oxopropionate reductase n=1 Tax=Ancylobacter defluvii TaxID=1282440 RepID=A0A9W6JVV6_9HYPH|nr:NAD(P)-dependent oxidoreductase [Ancylobacter defluvii]MBS7589139.1 NAD(P)-dependent oxidoreductase [Ancylobacter defluvii]GLK84751.1 2-hydroxy-3-oxopropionate reductase [Ancylobacter defluvii]